MKREVLLAEKTVCDGSPIYVIAEAGSNHNRDLNKAKGLIQIAAQAGADAVKFQTYVAEKLVSKSESLPDGANLCELFGKYELPYEWHQELMDYATSLGIHFLSSGFDFESVDLLDSVGVPAFKIASGDLTNTPLIKHIAAKGKPIILSTGMGTLREVAQALEAIASEGCDEVVLMHCVSSYPSPPAAMNLKSIDSLKQAFRVPVGLSDHTLGLQIPIAAAALGVSLIEKHFTDKREQAGLDHSYSLEPDELREMIETIRTIEEALGTGEKVCAQVETPTRYYARRSLFASRRIDEGERIQREDVKIVRPQKGIEPEFLDIVVGRTARKTIEEDEAITWDNV